MVRHIFGRYLRVQSVYDLAAELCDESVRSKVWTTRAGVERGGIVLTRGALFHLLSSRVYLGEIVHRDKVHAGLHDAIIDPDTFEAVAAKLKAGSVARRETIERAGSAPLVGKLYDDLGQLFSPSSGRGKSGKLYRYYIAMDLQRGAVKSIAEGRVGRLSAPAVEDYLVKVVERIGGRPVETGELANLIHKVEMRRDETHVVVQGAALFVGEHPELILNAVQKRLTGDELAVVDRSGEGRVRLVLPHALKLRGGETWLHGAEARKQSVNRGLLRALRRAHDDLKALNGSPQNLDAVETAEAPQTQHDRLVARLAFLSPDLHRRLLEGELPTGFTMKRFLAGSMPLAWADQDAWVASFN